MVRTLLFLFVLFLSGTGNAQYDIPYSNEYDLTYDKSEEKSLQSALEEINEADRMVEQIRLMYDNLDEKDKKMRGYTPSKELKNVMKELTDAVETYQEGYYELIKVYKDKCNAFWEEQRAQNHYATGLEKAKYYERLTTRYMAKAQTRRSKIEVIYDFEDAVYLTYEANKFDLLALQCQGRAAQIYKDFPVEYDYNWEGDMDIERILAEDKKHVVEEPQIPDSLFRMIEEPRAESSSDTVVIHKTDTVFVILKDTLDPNDRDIKYRVQIAAHTIPLDQPFLERIYMGNRSIFELREEGWYKYSIGVFDEYVEAKRVMENSGVEKAFITAYLGGKKITMTEALKKEGIQPPPVKK